MACPDRGGSAVDDLTVAGVGVGVQEKEADGGSRSWSMSACGG